MQAKLAGLDTIPAIVRHTEDEDLLRNALLENLHQSTAESFEEAFAYQQLMADFGATLKNSRRRSHVLVRNCEYPALLKLPPGKRRFPHRSCPQGHARALLGLLYLLKIWRSSIIAEGLSVRTTEELVRLWLSTASFFSLKRVKVLSPLGEHMSQVLADA